MKSVQMCLFLALCESMFAQSATTVSDTIYVGTIPPQTITGRMSITSPAGYVGTVPYAPHTETKQIVKGFFSIALIPNDQIKLCPTCAATGTSYKVQISPDGGKAWTETWVVPTSAFTLKLSDVRVGSVSPPTPLQFVPLAQLSVTGATAGQSIVLGSSGHWEPGAGGGGSGPVGSVTSTNPLTADVIVVGDDGLRGVKSLAAQSGNKFMGSPSNGLAGPIAPRALVSADIPNNAANTSGKASTAGNADTVTNGLYSTGTYADPTWLTTLAWAKIMGAPGTYAPTAHNLLSASHGDSTVGAAVRGDLITGQGASPLWTRLAKGTQYQTLQGGATEPSWGAVALAQATAVTGILPNSNTTAASANTASAIVARDGSGNFAAGTITATFSGALTGNVTGNASGTAATITGALALANTPLTARGDLLIATTATPILGKLAKGTQYQTLQGGTTDPGWSAIALGEATAVSGTLPATRGGTGVSNTASLTLGSSNVNLATLGTGIVKNTTTTGALTNAAYADVTGLWTTCTGYLKSDGTCDTPAGGGTVTVSGVPVLYGLPIWTAASELKGLAVPAAGTILQGKAADDPAFTNNPLLTAIAAPGTPTAGLGSVYVDSTSKNLSVKDDAGVVKHAVQTKAAVANSFVTEINDAGVISVAQPTPANLALGTLVTAMTVGTGGSVAPTSATVGIVSANKLNGIALSNLATGILKNFTTTGVPSIATAADLESPLFCSDAGATDTYACSVVPVIAAYAAGTHYRFKANTSNTGVATLNLNAVGAIAIKKWSNQNLEDNDIRVGQWVDVVYDGTYFQMQSQVGTYLEAGPTLALVLNRAVYPYTIDIDPSVVPTLTAANAWTGANSFPAIKGSGTAVTVTSGFGTSPSIAGVDTAFRVTLGTTTGTSGIVALKQTWANAPVIICNNETTNAGVRATPTATQVTLTQSFGTWADADKISCLALGY